MMTLIVLLIALFPYISFIGQDLFFPYWDPYLIKVLSYNFGTERFIPPTWDPLFFVNIRAFVEITGLSYYVVIRWGSLFSIVFTFFALFYLLKDIFFGEKETNKIEKFSLLIAMLVFFIEPFAFRRFSMTLRENFIFPILFINLYLFKDIFAVDKEVLLEKAIFLALMSSFFLASHMLVFLVFFGSLCFYIFWQSKKGKLIFKIKTIIIFLIVFLLISLPFLLKQSRGIVNQLLRGNTYIEREGFTVFRDFISLEYFNKDILLLSAIGLLAFLINKKSYLKAPQFLTYFFIVFIGFFGSFVERFGIRQNRFVIYIYMIFSLGFFNFLAKTSIKKKRLGMLIVSLFFILFFLKYTIPLMEVRGYRPITQKDVLYTQKLIDDGKLNINNNIYCGQSSCMLLKYLFPDHTSKIRRLDQYLDEVSFLSGDQVFLLKEDWLAFSGRIWVNRKTVEFIHKNLDGVVLGPNLKKEDFKNDIVKVD